MSVCGAAFLLQVLITGVLSIETQIIMLSSVVRYGATTFTPANTVITKYGNDTVDPDSRPPSLMLTNTGKRQMYNYGQYLASEYSTFFREYPLNETNMLVKTSAKQRTIEAAFSIITGMLNNTASITVPWDSSKLVPRFKNGKRFDQTGRALPYGWASIPIKSTTDESDTLLNLNSKDVCPNKNQVLTDKRTREINLYNPDKLREHASTVFNFYGISLAGHDLTNTTYCFSAFLLMYTDYMNRRDAYFKPDGPTWAFLKNCYEAHIMTLYGDDNYLRMAGSPLAIALLGNITKLLNDTIEPPPAKPEPEPPTRMLLVSAQEKSILPLLRILKMIDPDCIYKRYKDDVRTIHGENSDPKCVEFPHPGSAVIFELHKKVPDIPAQETLQAPKKNNRMLNITNYNGFYVRVRYNDVYYGLGSESFPDNLMPFEYFNKTLLKEINVNWETDCGIQLSQRKTTSLGEWFWLLAVTNGVMALVVVGLFAYLWKSKSNETADRLSGSQSLGDLEDPLNTSFNRK